jgi:hypothetical protein
MIRVKYFLIVIILLFLSACQRKNSVCPPVTGTSAVKPALSELILLQPTAGPTPAPMTVEIGGRMIEVDQLISGPLCNAEWSGTVYVGCNAIVADAELDAEENPLFFKGCSLNIEPNTVVYVAAHNDAAYYKGCSCHTGEDPLP